jgi:hypothetical protein
VKQAHVAESQPCEVRGDPTVWLTEGPPHTSATHGTT